MGEMACSWIGDLHQVRNMVWMGYLDNQNQKMESEL